MARMRGAKGVGGNGGSGKTRKPSSSMFAMALEPRFMFDAAGAASVADATQAEHAPRPTEAQDTSANQALADAAAHAVPPEARPADAATQIASQISGAAADGAAVQPASSDGQARVEIVFIDSSVPDYQVLVDNVQAGKEVVILDAAADGMHQIASYLQGRTGVDAIHIVTHGEEGRVLFGSGVLEMDTLQYYQNDLNAIRSSLTSDGDLLFYGCDVAEGSKGTLLTYLVASATDADVAFSTNPTGATAGKGDWLLEKNVGSIETSSAFQENVVSAYTHTLTDSLYVLTSNASTSSIGAGDTLYKFTIDGVQTSTTLSDGGTSGQMVNQPSQVAIDAIHNKAYVYDAQLSTRGIYVVDLGTGATSSFISMTDITASVTGAVLITDLQYDALNDELWASLSNNNAAVGSGDALIKISLDGNKTITTVLNNDTIKVPSFFSLDVANKRAIIVEAVNTTSSTTNSKVYSYSWASGNSFTEIYSIVYDSNVTNGINNGYVITGMSQDLSGKYIYLSIRDNNSGTANPGDKVVRLDSTNSYAAETIFSGNNVLVPGAVQVDEVNNRVLVLDTAGKKMYEASISGTLPATTTSVYKDFSSAVPTDIYFGDATKPTFNASTSTPADDATGVVAANDITLNFSERVIKGTTGNIVIRNVTDNSIIETLAFDSARITGWGTATLTIDPTSDLPAGKVISVQWDGNVIRDTSGNLLDANSTDTLFNFTTTGGADTTPPTVSSIAVSGTPAANASSVDYTVTFSESVTGVDAGDFTLATTGTANGSISSVTGSGTTYTVTVNGITGAGTLGLNLNSTGTGIEDTANNAIATGFTGSTHTVDRTAPTFDVAAAASSIISTGFSVSASIDEAGTIYYVVVADGATAPTAAEVEAGTASGGGAALKSGSLSGASSSPFTGIGSITGLTAGTAYDLYVVAKDSAGNLMGSPVKVDVVTAPAAPDAPTLDTASDSGSSGSDGKTNATTPVYTVTGVTSGATVTLFNDANNNGTVDAGETLASGTASGTSISLTVGSALSEASYTNIKAIQTVGGTDSAASTAASTLVVDTSGPTWSTSASLSVAENTTAVATLVATDTLSGGVSYSIVGGSDQGTFTLSGSSLSFTSAPNYESPTDSDANNTYVVTVRATDAAGNTSDRTITVTITDANDAPTDIALSNTTLTTGGATSGATVGSLTTTDQDSGQTHTYTLVSGSGSTDNASFSISGSSLVVGGGTLSAGTYSVRVRATDNGTGSLYYEKVFTVTVSNNANPVISDLNGDTKSWGGVGETVFLDTFSGSTGVASVSDAENDAADWGSGSLTVQRATGGAWSADVFAFSTIYFVDIPTNATSGTLRYHTQNTGESFASYTNVNGVLTITLNSAATTTMVSSLFSGITYRNDTPAGDATIRFTLNDGHSGSTTADVQVTTNYIYVTGTGDGSTVDVTDGVGLREAVAIAGGQTGTQTIVFDSGLANGTITLGSDLAVGENITFDADAASGLTITGGTITVASGTTLTLTNGTADGLTIASQITGSGGVTKTGAGTVTLTGGNDYSGATSIDAGKLTANDGIGDGSAVTVASGATLDLSGDETIGSLAGSGAVTLGGYMLSVGGANTSTSFDGIVSGTGGLSKAGSGTLTLTGANSYTGTTTVSAGTLELNSSAGTALADGSAVTVASGATLKLSSASETIGALSGVSGATLALGGNALTVKQSTNGTFSGAITGTSSGSLILNADANSTSLTLAGTTNSTGFAGGLTVTKGWLVATSDSNLGAGTLTLDGGTLRLSGTVGSIDNAVAIGSSGGTISIAPNGSVTLSGAISGSGSLIKAASGNLTLSGDNSSFSGAFNINAGTVTISHANALGSTTGSTTVADGAALSLSGGITVAENLTLSGSGVSSGGALVSASGSNTVSGTVTLNADATVTATSALTISGVVGGANALTKDGTGSLTLSGSNSYTGATTVSAGTLVAGHANALGTTAGSTTVDSGATLAVGSGVTLAENLTVSGTGVSSGGALQVTSGSATVSGTVAMGADTTIGVSGTELTISGVISGSQALTKTGGGMLTLSGDNSYTGATTVSTGVLHITHANALGTTATGTTVASGATLRIGTGLSIAENLTISGIGVSSGIGAVKVNGGTATITGAVTLGADASIGSYNSGDTLTISGTVSGGFNLTKVGDGTAVLSGTNSYTGTTTVSAGTLSIAGSGNISSAGITLNGGTLDVTGSAVTLANAIALGSGHGTVNVGSGNALTLSGVISGANSLTKSGAGTLTLSGTGTYTGTTTVGAGTLVVTGTLNGSSPGAVTVGNGATLAGSGTVNGGLTVQSGGSLSPGVTGTNNGVGTLTVNGGLTIQPGGTLAVDLVSASSYDQVAVTGAVNVSSATLTAGGSYTPAKTASGDSFAIISNDGSDAVTGTFTGLASGATLTLNSGSITVSYAAGTDSNDVVLTGPVNQAPALAGIFTTAGTVNDNATTTPFGGVTVADTDDSTGTFTVTITYTAANGTLSSAGGGLTGSAGNYTLTATTPGGLQTLLQALVFTPTDNQVVPGSTVQTTFSLTASDGTSSSSANTSTVVTASSINDAPTDIALSNSSVTIFDGTNAVVGTLSATDADTGQTLTYTLVSGSGDTDNGLFNISGTSLRANDAATLTGGQSYSVRVRVSDGTSTSEQTFTITVTNDLVVDVTAIDGSAPAGTYAVDKADGGGLDLLEAINLANNVTGTITIRFLNTLGGTITLPSTLTVRSGVTLAMDSDTDSRSITITGNGFTLGNSFGVSVGEGDTLTIDSTLADNGTTDAAALTKSGAGTLVLGGTNNTATGGTSGTGINTITVDAGTLSVAGDANLGTGTVTMSGGTLTVTGATTIDNAITLSADSSITNANAVTLSGDITGTGGLTKLSSGKLTLSSANNVYSGGTTLRGEVELGTAGTIGSGTITLNGGTLTTTAASQTLTNAIAMTGAGTVKTANALTLSGTVSGTGALTKDGAGTVTLSGTNSHSGSITISAGTLAAAGGSAIGDGSAVSVGGSGTLSLSANETIGSLTGSGTVSLGAYTLTAGGDNNSTTFSGVIGGTGGLTKAGSGTLTLSGANTYTGATTVSGGTLTASGGSAIGDSSAVSVSSGATLDLQEESEEVGSLAGAGTVVLNGGTLTVGGNDQSTEFSGVIQTGSEGGTLTKMGSGTLTLSGSNSSSFSGGIAVREGTLSVTGDANLGSDTVTLNGGTLTVTGAGTIDNTFDTGVNGATIDTGVAVTLSGAIGGNNSLTKTGTGALTLSGTSTYAGQTTVSAGTLLVTGALNGTSGMTVASGATLGGTGSIFASGSSNTLTVASGATLAPGVAGTNNGIGTLTVNGILSMSGTLAVEIAGTGSPGTDYDQVIVSGGVTLSSGSSAVTVTRVNGFAATNSSYTVIDQTGVGAVSNTLSGLAQGATMTSNGDLYTVDYVGGTGNDLMLDAIVNPTVSSVTATTADGTYKAGSTVTITIAFNRAVTVSGTPTLTLGISGRSATYSGGSGTTTLTFTYTVQDGDNSTDLDYASTGALTLNGGGIADSSTSLDAILTLATPGAANSLGANKAIVIDTAAPTVSSVSAVNGTYRAGETIDVTVTFSEAVTVTGTPTFGISLDNGTVVQATYLSGSGGTALTFRYTVGTDLADADGIGIGGSISGGSIADLVGNSAVRTLSGVASMAGVRIDSVHPTVTNVTSSTVNGTYTTGETVSIQVTFSEAVTVSGTPTLALNTGRPATYSSGAGTNTLTFTYTVQAGDTAADLDATSTSALTGSITDIAGNAGVLTLTTPGDLRSLGLNKDIAIDTTAPSIRSVVVPTDGTYGVGTTMSFYIQASEVLIVNGTPTITLDIGGQTRQAVYNPAASSGTVLRFDYVVQAGDNDADGIAVSGLNLNGGSITDKARIPLPTTLAGVPGLQNVLVDTVAPDTPSVPVLAPGQDTGVSATDGVTNIDRPTLGGTAEAGSTVTVLVDGVAVGTTIAGSDGSWSFTPTTPLADGTHAITSRATDRAGNSSGTSAALTLTVDTTPPVLSTPAISGGIDNTANVTAVNRPTLTGTADPNSTVTVIVDGVTVGTAITGSDGRWSFAVTTPLADGSHSVVTTATDGAGNIGRSGTLSLTVDTQTPTVSAGGSAPTLSAGETATLGSAVSLSDASSLNRVTVTLTDARSGDELVIGTLPAGITATRDGNSIVLSGVASTADYQAAVRAIGLRSSATDPSFAGTATSRSISIQARDLVGNSSAAAAVTVTVARATTTTTSTTNTTNTPTTTTPVTVSGNGPSQSGSSAIGSSSNGPSSNSSSSSNGLGGSGTGGSGPTLPGSGGANNGSGTPGSSSSTDSGRSVTLNNIGGGSSSTDAGRSVTLNNIGGGSSSTDAGRSVTLNSIGGGSSNSSGSGSGSGLGGGLGGGLGSGLGGGLGGAALNGGGLGGGSLGNNGLGSGFGTGGTPGGTGTGTNTGTGTGTGGATRNTTGGQTGQGAPTQGTGGQTGTQGNGQNNTQGRGQGQGLGQERGNAPGTGQGRAPATGQQGSQGPQGQGEQGQGPNQGQGEQQDQPQNQDAPQDGGGTPANGAGQPADRGADNRAEIMPASPGFARQVARAHGGPADAADLLAALASHVLPDSWAA